MEPGPVPSLLPPPPPVAPMVVPYATPAHLAIPPDWTNVEVFCLDPTRLSRWLWILIAINVSMVLVVGGVFVAVSCAFVSEETDRLMTGIVSAVWMVGYGLFATLRAMGKAKRQWREFRLVVADQGLYRCGPAEPSVTVHCPDIRYIDEEFDAFCLHMGASICRVPKRIENVARVRQRLMAWQAPRRTQSRTRALVENIGKFLLAPACLGATVLGLQSQQLWVAIACAVVSVGTAAIQVFLIWRNLTLSIWLKVGSLLILCYTLLVPLRVARVLLAR